MRIWFNTLLVRKSARRMNFSRLDSPGTALLALDFPAFFFCSGKACLLDLNCYYNDITFSIYKLIISYDIYVPHPYHDFCFRHRLRSSPVEASLIRFPRGRAAASLGVRVVALDWFSRDFPTQNRVPDLKRPQRPAQTDLRLF